jgi:hypothetical protein
MVYTDAMAYNYMGNCYAMAYNHMGNCYAMAYSIDPVTYTTYPPTAPR